MISYDIICLWHGFHSRLVLPSNSSTCNQSTIVLRSNPTFFFFLFFYFSCLVDWFLIRLLLKADRETQIVSRHAIIFDCRLLLFSSIGRFPLGCWEVQLMAEDPKRDVDCRRVMHDEMIFSTGKTIEMLPARWLRWRLVWNWFRWLRSQLLGCVHSVRDAKRNGWQTDRFHQFQ